MKKWWFLILTLVLLVYGCGNVSEEKPVLNELQTTACESASSNNNCERLDDLGLVSGRDCCYALNECCGDGVTGRAVQNTLSDIPVDEFKSVLIKAIKDYFSSSPTLTTAELKDLIVAYLSTPGNNVDLSETGEYSGENLNDIYNKAQAIPSCTDECSSSGARQCYGTNAYQTCGNYDDDSCLEWGTTANCPSSQTCSNGQCVSPPQNCSGTCKESPCSSYQSCSSASGSCTTGYCCTGTCSVSNTTQYHMGCYNNNIYWFDTSNKPVELIQECTVDCQHWPENSFCYERSDGKVEVRIYPACFETFCQKNGSNEQFYCYNAAKDGFPAGVYNVEYWKADCYTFTINKDYKNNPRYWYIGEPASPILPEDMVEGRGMPKYNYTDPDHPKIVNRISTSGVYWNEEGILVRSPSNVLAKAPCRILTDLIPFYEENNIEYYPGYACTGGTCLCEDKCFQSFTDSYFYKQTDYVDARCI